MKEVYYEAEWSNLKDVVWIHASDGSTVGRFGRMGVDLHNTVTEQMAGAPECRLCTHGKVTAEDWKLFREKSKEFWGVDIPEEAFDKDLLLSTGA
jgi:hypothetical protein